MTAVKFRILSILNKNKTIIAGWLLLSSFYCFAQKEKPHSAEYYFEQGEEALQKKQSGQALDYFNECIQKSPDFPDAYYSRGIANEQLKRYDEALTDYNIYVELKPDHFEALFNRAVLRYRLGKFEQAKGDFEQLITMPQGETSTIFFRQDAFASSVNKIFTTQGSDRSYLYNYLGLTEIQLKDFTKAIEHFSMAIQAHTGEADYYANRGLAKEKAGRVDEARDDYRMALKINSDHEVAKHNLSTLTLKEGKKTESTQMLDDAISNSPSLPYPYAERGFARMEQKNWRGALEDYTAAIRIDSMNEEYFLNRGLTKEKLKDFDGAYRDYSKAISLKENFEKAWLNRGNLLSRLNRLPEAIDDYTIAIFYYPEYAVAYYNRSVAYYRQKKFNDACIDLTKAETFGFRADANMKHKICLH
jgi:tetratricopeptide (TPR) repeat protein